MSIIINGKRSVAYFDLLGFKNKIKKNGTTETALLYEKLIRNTDTKYFTLDYLDFGVDEKYDSCFRFVFSDSIFLIAKEDNEESFIDLFSYTYKLMQISIAMKCPLRGAISYGDIYVNFEKNIFLGEAINNAVILEGKQQWIGGILDENVVERYSAIFEDDYPCSGLYEILLPIAYVPLKNYDKGLYGEYYRTINWRCNIVSSISFEKMISSDTTDESVKQKVKHTLQYIDNIEKNKLHLLNDEKVSPRYRRFFILDCNEEEAEQKYGIKLNKKKD